MSRENVEIVRRMADAYESGDVTRWLEAIDSDVVLVRVPPLPDPGTYHGKEGVMQAIIEWSEDFDEFVMTAEEFIDLGEDFVLVRVHQDITGERSGIALSGDVWFLIAVRDGKCTRIEMHWEKAEALEAAGLSE